MRCRLFNESYTKKYPSILKLAVVMAQSISSIYSIKQYKFKEQE